MKKIVLIVFVCFMPGCFAAQYNAINRQAEEKNRALDEQCKINMTDWCVMQYALIQRQREIDLDDVQRRQAATAEAIRSSGDGFKNLGNQRTNR